MRGSGLLAVYREYLACLNARRWDDLGRFVADEVLYNGKLIGLNGYREMLVSDTHAIPGLEFVPEILLADEHVVACRLFFQCTPRHAFLGFEPTGGQVSFAEHVFYRFDNGQIVDVRSLIDTETIREQISREMH